MKQPSCTGRKKKKDLILIHYEGNIITAVNYQSVPIFYFFV